MENPKAFGIDTEALYQKLSDQIARNHNQTKEQQAEIDKLVEEKMTEPETLVVEPKKRFNVGYAKEVQPYTAGHSDVTLTNYNKETLSEKLHITILYISDKLKTSKFARLVIAGALAGTVGISGLSLLNNIQSENMEKGEEIVKTVDLADEVYGDNDLIVRADGEAAFVNSEGDTFKVYNDINADDLAGYNQTPGKSL